MAKSLEYKKYKIVLVSRGTVLLTHSVLMTCSKLHFIPATCCVSIMPPNEVVQ